MSRAYKKNSIKNDCRYELVFPKDSKIEVNYVNGKKEGNGRVLTMNNELLAEVSFHEDILCGTCKLFNTKGDKVREYEFDCIQDSMIEIDTEEEEANILIGILKNGSICNDCIENYEESSVASEKKGIDDIMNIMRVKLYDNGNVAYEGEWLDGKFNGSGVLYYENGNKHYEGEWLDGKWNGSGVNYYDNGNKQYEGEWRDGKANGSGVCL